MLAVLLLTVVASLPLSLVPAAPAAAAASFANTTFVGVNQVTLTGSKDAGSTLEIRRSGSGGIFCEVSDPASTSWSCPTVTLPNGQYTFTGVETLDDSSIVSMAPVTITVVGPPRLDGAPGSTLTTGRFTGSGEPGADLRILSSGPGGNLQHACPDVLGDGFWSCIINVPSGEHTIRAIQSMPQFDPSFSSPSATLAATIDRDAPAAPTVTAPANGTVTEQRQVVVSGLGEAGANIQVFVNSEQRCVLDAGGDGEFRCTIELGSPGLSTIQVLQRDAAGNFSAPSPRIEIEYAPPAAAPAPAPNAPAPGSPPPAPEEPSDTEDPDAPEPTPDTDDESVTPVPPSPTPTPAPPRRPGGPAPTIATDNWGTLTGFGGSLPTATQILERGGWLLAPIVGIGYLLLIALPTRAVVRSSLPRLLPAPLRLTGRNRGVIHESDAPLLPGWLVAVGVFAGAALVAALSGGIALEVRYLRLMAAIGLGLVVLNGLAVVLPARLAGRRHRVVVSERLLPAMLLGAVVAALVSRLWELQPPMLIGVLIATTFTAAVPRAARAGVAIAQTSGVAVLALAGWAAHDLLTPAYGFWANFAAETAAAIALGGLGSLLLLLLPVGQFPGRALYTVSRAGWSVITVLTAAVGGAIAFSGPNFPLLPLALASAAFAAACSAVFVWTRFVEPTLR